MTDRSGADLPHIWCRITTDHIRAPFGRGSLSWTPPVLHMFYLSLLKVHVIKVSVIIRPLISLLGCVKLTIAAFSPVYRTEQVKMEDV